jgi:salicylate hydroxylase
LPAEFRRRETTIWLFSDAHVVHYPVRAGQELAVVVVVDDYDGDAEWNAPVEAGWVQQRLPSGAGALHSLIASGSSWRSWSLHTLKTPPRWTSGRATLLGDAAHPVLPFLAQGAVMALEDASVLAQALDGRDDISAALQSYERQRRARVTKVARASRRNGRIYHMRGMRAAARNMVLRKSSPERLMAQYDWLYGWRND